MSEDDFLNQSIQEVLSRIDEHKRYRVPVFLAEQSDYCVGYLVLEGKQIVPNTEVRCPIPATARLTSDPVLPAYMRVLIMPHMDVAAMEVTIAAAVLLDDMKLVFLVAEYSPIQMEEAHGLDS